MAPAAALVRTLPAGTFTFRGCLRQPSRPFKGLQEHGQRRWIGLKRLSKFALAQQHWDIQAAQIQAGEVKNLFDELDERGFIKDVVGR